MLLKRLFRRGETAALSAHSLPDGERVYAFGDIHGRYDLLEELFQLTSRDYQNRGRARTTMVFLGDLIDRGPDSRRVVERLMALAQTPLPTVFLMGNHEELLLNLYDGDEALGGVFHRAGGRATLLSYGVDPELYDNSEPQELPAMARAHVPEEHIAFIRSFDNQWRCGDYSFVHAGFRPGVPLENQTATDMRWIRREFIESDYDFGAMVVHGHTITKEVDEQINRIGIDTGAFNSGVLTALRIEGRERWYLQTGMD